MGAVLGVRWKSWKCQQYLCFHRCRGCLHLLHLLLRNLQHKTCCMIRAFHRAIHTKQKSPITTMYVHWCMSLSKLHHLYSPFLDQRLHPGASWPPSLADSPAPPPPITHVDQQSTPLIVAHTQFLCCVSPAHTFAASMSCVAASTSQQRRRWPPSEHECYMHR